MRKITFSQATQEAMAETMAKDPTVFAMGEDLARQALRSWWAARQKS